MGAAIELKPMTGNEKKPVLTINIEQREALSTQVIRQTVAVDTLKITCDEDYEIAAELLKDLKRLDKEIAEFFKPVVKAWHEGHKDVKAQENTLRDPLVKILDRLGKVMGKYQADLEQQRKIEREMVLAQQKAEMDASALEIAQGLEESGDSAGAQAVVEQAAKMQPEVNVESFAPHVRGTAKRTTWQFEIVNPDLVPDKYWVINEQMIQAEVNACKENTNIPGVRVTSETKVSARV